MVLVITEAAAVGLLGLPAGAQPGEDGDKCNDGGGGGGGGTFVALLHNEGAPYSDYVKDQL